jgi:hypothetical protein
LRRQYNSTSTALTEPDAAGNANVCQSLSKVFPFEILILIVTPTDRSPEGDNLAPFVGREPMSAFWRVRQPEEDHQRQQHGREALSFVSKRKEGDALVHLENEEPSPAGKVSDTIHVRDRVGTGKVRRVNGGAKRKESYRRPAVQFRSQLHSCTRARDSLTEGSREDTNGVEGCHTLLDFFAGVPHRDDHHGRGEEAGLGLSVCTRLATTGQDLPRRYRGRNEQQTRPQNSA